MLNDHSCKTGENNALKIEQVQIQLNKLSYPTYSHLLSINNQFMQTIVLINLNAHLCNKIYLSKSLFRSPIK